MFLKTVRHKITRFLLADEVELLQMERESFARVTKNAEEERQRFEDWAEKQTSADALRAQLKSFDPKLLDSEDQLPEVLGDDENQIEFLNNVKSLSGNRALNIICDYLKRNLIIDAAKYGKDIDAINFSRASINGLGLLREEIERLLVILEERHPKETEFDKHEVV